MVQPTITREQIEAARRRLGLGGVAAQPPPAATPPQPQPSSGGGLLSLAGRAFGVIPDPVQHVLKTVGKDLLSAEEALNVPGFQLGTAVRGGIERFGNLPQRIGLPGVGGALGTAFDIGAAPATLIPGFTGGRLSVAAGRALGPRLGAEVATALGAAGAGGATALGLREAKERGLPVPDFVQTLAPIAAGIAGGLRVAKQARPTRIIEDLDARLGTTAPTVRKLNQALEAATPIRVETLAARSKELEKRAAKMEALTKRRGPLTEELVVERGGLRAGKLPRAEIASIRSQFTEGDVNTLLRAIEQHPPFEQLIFTRTRLQKSLLALLDPEGGRVPTRSEAAALEEVFGEGFAAALKTNVPFSLREKAFDALGVPRSIVTSADVSAPFRQGLLVAFKGRGPRVFGTKVIPLPNPTFWRAWKPMLRAFGSEDFAQAELLRIRNRPGIGIAEKAKLSRTSFATTQLEDREEQFRSAIAESIPILGRLIRASNRAYTTFLNRLRADSFDDYAAELMRVGQGTDANFKALATAMNTLTGRGKVPGPRALEEILNAGFFAPKFVFARFRTPVDLVRAPAAIRRQMAADVVGTFAAVSTGLVMLKVSGLAEVELNPKSSDFGKARFGSVRIDPWGGFQPIARYLWQITTGERKSTGSGDIREAGRIETAEKFLESKLAPVPGALLDLIRGRTFLGEEVEFGARAEFDDVITSRLVPLVLQDINDAMIERGMLGAAFGFPGVVGVGVQAFTTRADLQNELAAAEFGKPWDQITGQEQQVLELANEESFERIRIRSDFDNTRDEINDGARASELELSQALESGFDPRQVNQALSDVNRERQIRTNQAFKDFGFASQDDDDVVSVIFAKREEAVSFGIVDFQELDQITEAELAKLTPDQRRLWDQRRRFIHDPSVQHIFASKDLIAESGYWQLQRDAFERFAFQITRIDPGIVTYQQLDQAIRIAEREDNRGRSRRLNGIKRRIDTRTAQLRKTARRKDRLLDDALVLVYGLKSVR